MSVTFFLFIAIIVLLVKVYRGGGSSRKIVFKLVLAIISVVFTFSMIGMAVDSYDSLTYASEHYSLEGRLETVERYYRDGQLDRMADSLEYSNDYEEEFDKYWQVLIDAEK